MCIFPDIEAREKYEHQQRILKSTMQRWVDESKVHPAYAEHSGHVRRMRLLLHKAIISFNLQVPFSWEPPVYLRGRDLSRKPKVITVTPHMIAQGDLP